MEQIKKSGLYETDYGNACRYKKGAKSAFDLDMQERIPIEMVNFAKPIINNQKRLLDGRIA